MFSEKIVHNLEKSSWIRAMFDQGVKLAQKYGEDKVYDFSLGNPYAEPPEVVLDSLRNYVLSEKNGLHRYMSNAGYPEVRKKIAQLLETRSEVELSAENIVMTVGAAGGLNVVLKALLNPGEEVMVFAPYFVEYNFYVDNHGGKTIVIPPDLSTFEPDLAILENSITPKTKALIINIPNNPSGVIYREETLKAISSILAEKEQEFKTRIYVISDQPYSEIIYDGAKMPDFLSIFPNTLIVNSFSKSLGLAGERIGYIAASSRIKDIELLIDALSFCNRTLGFVNAPGLFQRVAGDALEARVDIGAYKQRRDFLYENLTKLGFSCVKPQGAFYLFPQTLMMM